MKTANLTVLTISMLVACAGPAPITQEVKIPVFTPCVKVVPTRPAFESLALPGDASNGDKVMALARDTLQHFRYEGQLEAALAGCL